MKKRIKNSNLPKELQLCIKVAAVIIGEHTLIAHDLRYSQKEISAFAEAVTRLGQISPDEKHLAELLEALDYEMAQVAPVPLDKRGTQLLKRVLRGSLPDID
jgi:hypothetical protein